MIDYGTRAPSQSALSLGAVAPGARHTFTLYRGGANVAAHPLQRQGDVGMAAVIAAPSMRAVLDAGIQGYAPAAWTDLSMPPSLPLAGPNGSTLDPRMMV